MTLIETITIINMLVLYYFIGSAIFYTILLFASMPTIYSYFKRTHYTRTDVMLNSNVLPPLTIVVAFYNERENIINVVESALNSTYPNIYIILVNDVSTDDTLEILNKHYELTEVPVIIEQKIPTTPVKRVLVSKKHTNLMVIDKERNAGTGDSVNIGVNACFTPYFMTLDADSFIGETAVSEFIFDLLTNEGVVAVGGGVYILNGCRCENGKMIESLLPRRFVPLIQSLEYIRSHLFSRAGWNLFGGTMGYSGTATVYERKAIIAAGGFDPHNFAQDMEIIMRLHSYMHKHHKPYQVVFNPAATVWTDVPSTFKEFAKQRDKWRRGILRASLRYWYMFFNPRYGIQGMLGYPGYALLEVMAPIVEFSAYLSVGFAYYLGIFDAYTTFLFILLAWGFVSYLTVGNMVINLITFNYYRRFSDIFIVFILTIVETFGFRQYTTLISIYGTIHYLINRMRGKPQ